MQRPSVPHPENRNEPMGFLLFNLYLLVICTICLVLSIVTLVVCYPFDRRRHAVHELSRLLVRLFFAVPTRWTRRIEGLEKIDRSKSYVIGLNHNSMLDIPALYFVPLDFRWVSKREVWKIPFFGQMLYLHGDILIDRRRGAQAMAQLMEEGGKWLGRGVSVAIFPEGTRSADGTIRRFKSGAFQLAREAGVELLPVVLDGTRTIVRPGSFLWNWRNRLTLRILDPVPVEEVRSTDPHELSERTRERMIAALAESKN